MEESLSSVSQHSSLLDIEFPPAILLPLAALPKDTFVPPLDLGFVKPQLTGSAHVAEPICSWEEKEEMVEKKREEDEEPSLTISSSSEEGDAKQDISRFSAFGVSSDFSKDGKSVDPPNESNPKVSDSLSFPLLDVSQSAVPSHFIIEDSLHPEESPLLSLRLTTKCSSEATTQTHRISPIVRTFELNVVAKDGQTKLNEYKIEREVGGKGVVGAWYLAQAEERVVLWECNKEEFGEEVINMQIKLFQRIAHSNILRLLEVIEAPDSNFAYLVFEGVRGPLLDSPFSHEEAKEAFRGLVHGVNYLHNVAQVAHLGVKPEALFMGIDGEIKLGEFSAAKELNGMEETCKRIEDHRGRRRRIKQHYKPTDIFACGVTLYRLLYGTSPFSSQSDEGRGRGAWCIPESIDASLRDLFEGLLHHSPRKRLKISEVLRHPWLG